MIEASRKQPVYLKYQIYTKFRSQVLSHLLAPRISVWLDYTSKHKDTRTCSYEKLSFVLLSILFQTNLEGWMGGWCGMNEARAWKGGRRGRSVGRGRESKVLGWCRVGFGVVGVIMITVTDWLRGPCQLTACAIVLCLGITSCLYDLENIWQIILQVVLKLLGLAPGILKTRKYLKL